MTFDTTCRIYLSRIEDGAWSVPENLGAPVNSDDYEYGPYIAPDGEYLYFTSHRRGTADLFRIPVRAVNGGPSALTRRRLASHTTGPYYAVIVCVSPVVGGEAPVKPHWFYILLSVSAAPRYGAAIQDDIRELSGGDVRLWPATLYGSLEELAERGWLEEVAHEERPDGISGRERFYRITPLGREALEREASRMESLARVTRARLGHGSAGA